MTHLNRDLSILQHMVEDSECEELAHIRTQKISAIADNLIDENLDAFLELAK